MKLARLAALLFLLPLAACSGDRPWHATNITGGMPRLDFRMTRANDGRQVTAEDFRGHVAIVYFGYTHCPDVCPATLANLSEILQRLGKRADDVRILFVTVDPARDTPEILKSYTEAFGPQVIGLTGSANNLARLARAYRVAYSIKTAPTHEVMHSNAVFFFDRDGRARLVATSTTDTAGLAEDVERLLN
jgi:protein SCO1/2